MCRINILRMLLIAAFLFSTGLQLRADDVMRKILDNHTVWNSAEFSGKLKTDKLPVSVTLKIYMLRDSLIQISARAPFVGEVGRLTIGTDSIEIVNKLKKVYCRESMDNLQKVYPALIADLQGVLLARVVKFGSGPLDVVSFSDMTIEPGNDGQWLITPPLKSDSLFPLNYGYVVSENGRVANLVVSVASKDIVFQIDYSYENRGEQMDITYAKGKKKTNVKVDFSTVRWGGQEMQPIKVDKMSRVGIKELLRSLK
ncbi:MAG: DUF4292 domain-containing protein [Candidatus Amulumruptor caecigallinarius]|nr:DUF4292 domain-containing protein [Candidatus Amulumruptor caecigallinarius]